MAVYLPIEPYARAIFGIWWKREFKKSKVKWRKSEDPQPGAYLVYITHIFNKVNEVKITLHVQVES